MESLQQFAADIPKAALAPILLLMVLVYLMPTLIALVRRRRNVRQILAVNLVAGLSWASWLAAVAWAASGAAEKPPAETAQARARGLLWPAAILAIVLVAVLLK